MPDTLACARAGCVPCCYKVVLKGAPGARPNARPEACPRFVAASARAGRNSAAGQAAGLYRPSQRILTVGDGDFSFSLALARALGPAVRGFVATSYELLDSLRAVYPDIDATLAELRRLGAEAHHGVDAADLAGTLPPHCTAAPARATFDRVVWNFPCVARGEDGGVLPGAGSGADARSGAELERNQSLVGSFVRGASALLARAGEVHVTHKIKLQQWGIDRAGDDGGGSDDSAGVSSEPARFVGSVVFDRSCYPPYAPRQALRNRSFPISDAQTFIFSNAPLAESGTLARKGATPGGAAVKLSEAILAELQQVLGANG